MPIIQASLALNAGLQTTLTPRLQQSVHLLQLSSTEFAAELESALATNPFLEVASGAAPLAAQPFGAPDTAVVSASDFVDASTSHDRFERELVAPSSRSARRDDGHPEPAEQIESASTLRDHLHRELSTHRLGERDRAIVALVVESLDDDGYLRQELDEAASRFPFDPPVRDDEWRFALTLVQQLEPAGVAARDVAECLVLQLRARAKTGLDPVVATLALAIARDALDLVARRDWPSLRQRFGCDAAALDRAIVAIRRLDPRPGAAFGATATPAVVPDVVVRKAGRRWHVDVNPAVMPRTRLNAQYAELFHRARCDERQPMAQQLQEARWLLRNAAQRIVTIERVARAIVDTQHAFLDYGEIALKPLLMREIADRLGLHESTISRATGNKYMQTPRGIFEFKHFFSRALTTDTGGRCSASSIRAAMRSLIEAEDRAAPLSDVALVAGLADQGVRVARRTVSKYRVQMKIAVADLRRDDGSLAVVECRAGTSRAEALRRPVSAASSAS